MNTFIALNVDVPDEPPRWRIIKPPEVYLRSTTPFPKISLVVFAIMGRLNHHIDDKYDIEVYPSGYPFQYPTDSVYRPR